MSSSVFTISRNPDKGEWAPHRCGIQGSEFSPPFANSSHPSIPISPRFPHVKRPSRYSPAHDSVYCAVNASSTLPGNPTEKVYPDPTKTVPSTIAGPGAAIEPPFALTPFTVSKSRAVLYSQSKCPLSLENARTTPSQLFEKMTPGMAVNAAVSPRGPGAAGPSIGVNHCFSPFVSRTAATPPVLNPK